MQRFWTLGRASTRQLAPAALEELVGGEDDGAARGNLEHTRTLRGCEEEQEGAGGMSKERMRMRDRGRGGGSEVGRETGRRKRKG